MISRLAPSLSIRQLLLVITAGLTLMVALLSARDLYANAQRLERAQTLSAAIATSDLMFDATAKIAVERDLALSMLRAPDAETIDTLRPALIEARAGADAAVEASLAALSDAEGLSGLRHALEAKHAAIRTLRVQIDRALEESRQRRDPGLAARWESAAEELLAESESLWLAYIRPFMAIDPIVTQHLRYRQSLRTITDYTGRERSIIGQVLSENAEPSPAQTGELLRAQGVLALSWRNARIVAEQSGLYATVASAFADAESHYATLYDMTREMFYVPHGSGAAAFPLGADLYFELSSQASESLAVLREASRAASGVYLDDLIARTERGILVQAILSIGAVLLCAASFWIVLVRVVGPISRITDALVRAARGEIVDFSISGQRRDEIGKLAQVLEAFHGNVAEIRRTATERDNAARALEAEVGERRLAQQRVHEQLERLALLHRISRAIGERQEMSAIFEVAVASVEKHLPADFDAVCLFDQIEQTLEVVKVAPGCAGRAGLLDMKAGAKVPVDGNGLSRCMEGRLVHEPSVASVPYPFPQRLARAGLNSLVAAPLQVESQVFGAMIVARALNASFSSGECEFLRQLSEHVALAAHQSQLNTALQQAYDELRLTQEAVMQQERLRALGQMASGIAHDINNALSPVALYTESLLATEPGISAAGRAKLEIVQRAIDDAAHTIARMNEFYRKREAGLDMAPVNANTLMQQVIDLTQARWRDMPQQLGQVIEMRTEFHEPAPLIRGVESELREALTNLVFNAIDAMPEGGVVTLRTRLGRGGLVTLDVQDSGVGMDEATRQRCFEPFFTTKGERGTGLGLAMVYGTVQRHGGGVEIESEPGKGSLLRLSFASADRQAAQDTEAGAAPLGRRLRLLVIDDDPIICRSLREVLEGDGHVVHVSGDGESGVAAFGAALGERRSFDAVITDLGMPRMDGRRVASEVKRIAPHTPVILLTGWGERLRAEEEAPAHIDCILSKPPRLKQVRVALAQLCQPLAQSA